MTKSNRLKRALNPMPSFVRSVLEKERLMKSFRNRPPYQQNDYLGWIVRAKREATKQLRLKQMLQELKDGGLYMRMHWSPALGRKVKDGTGF